MTGEEGARLGYCRISNKYQIAARIDRPDVAQVLAEHLHRAPADFYVPRTDYVDAGWEDYYRRTLSHDRLVFGRLEDFKKLPSSCGTATGFIPRLVVCR